MKPIPLTRGEIAEALVRVMPAREAPIMFVSLEHPATIAFETRYAIFRMRIELVEVRRAR